MDDAEEQIRSSGVDCSGSTPAGLFQNHSAGCDRQAKHPRGHSLVHSAPTADESSSYMEGLSDSLLHTAPVIQSGVHATKTVVEGPSVSVSCDGLGMTPDTALAIMATDVTMRHPVLLHA